MVTHVDEFLLLLVLRAPSLVLEHHIVVPSPLAATCEILLVEQWVPEGDVPFPLVFFCLCALCFLQGDAC